MKRILLFGIPLFVLILFVGFQGTMENAESEESQNILAYNEDLTLESVPFKFERNGNIEMTTQMTDMDTAPDVTYKSLSRVSNCTSLY